MAAENGSGVIGRLAGSPGNVGGAYRRPPAAPPPNMYLDFARRWWPVLLLGIVLGVAGAVWFLKKGPVPYDTTTLIQVNAPIPTGGGNKNKLAAAGKIGNDPAAIWAAQILVQPILDKAAAALQDQTSLSGTDLSNMVQSKDISVLPQRGANLISLTVTNSDQQLGQLLAKTITNTFVNDVNSRDGVDVDAKRQQLQQQIEVTRQQLISAQLQQRQQDLTKQLKEARAQLLQLQLQYQQELDHQALVDMRTAPAPGATPDDGSTSRLTPDQQQQIQDASNAAAQSQSQTLQILADRQNATQSAVADLNSQLLQVRQALASLPTDASSTDQTATDDSADSSDASADAAATPTPTPVTSADITAVANQISAVQLQQQQAKDVQEQRTNLQLQQQDLNRQLDGLRTKLAQLQRDYQAEVERQAALQQHALAPAPAAAKGAPPVSAAQQQQEQQAADTAARARAQALQLLTNEQQSTQKGIDDLQHQLDSVQQSLAALPTTDSAALAQTLNSLQQRQRILEQQQRDQQQQADQQQRQQQQQTQQRQQQQDLATKQLTDQRAQLQQRAQDLTKQLQDQNNALLEVRFQYQQEVQRQTEANQHDVQAAVNSQANAQAKAVPTQQTNPDTLKQQQELAQTSAQVRTAWLQVVSEQQKDVQALIDSLNSQLNDVNASIDALPIKTDPTIANAFAEAYSKQLRDLTTQYTDLQLNQSNVTPLLQVYGDPSTPTVSSGLKKTLLVIAAGGMALGLGVALLLELLRRWWLARAANKEQRIALPQGAAAALNGNGKLAVSSRTARTARRHRPKVEPAPVAPDWVGPGEPEPATSG